jgi:hypothetical protein
MSTIGFKHSVVHFQGIAGIAMEFYFFKICLSKYVEK